MLHKPKRLAPATTRSAGRGEGVQLPAGGSLRQSRRQPEWLVLDIHWGTRCLRSALDDAQRLGERAIESRRASYADSRPMSCTYSVRSLSRPDRLDAGSGEAHYRQAFALAEPRGMRPLVAHCHLGLAKHYRRTGDRAKAEEHLATATAMYREMDMGFYLRQAETV